MPNLDLPTGLRGDSETPRQTKALRNCYFENSDIGTIITRPVARNVSRGVGNCRASGYFKDQLYQVSNDRLIRITLNNSDAPPVDSNIIVENLGEIVGNQLCVMKSSFTQLIIIVQGGAKYAYDDVNGLREITDPLAPPSVSLDFESGNWVFVPSNGDPFYWGSDIAIQTDPNNILLEFADAELFTDLNKCVIARKRQLLVGGSRSFERFVFDSNSNSYVPINGATSNYGYVGGLTDYGDTFMFLGQGVNGGFSFFVMAETATPIPNKAVDEILASYGLFELENIVGETFRWESQDIAVFYLPNHTIAFFGDFALWYSGTLGDGMAAWRVSFMQLAYGYIWTGDTTSNTISILTEDDKEYEQTIEGEIQTFLSLTPRSNNMIHRIWLAANSGINQSNQAVGLQVSKNGKSWGEMRYRSLGVLGDYNKEISWGSPVVKAVNHLGVRFRWVGNIRLACDQVYYE